MNCTFHLLKEHLENKISYTKNTVCVIKVTDCFFSYSSLTVWLYFFFPGNNGKFEGVANVMSQEDHGNVSDGKWFSLLLLLLLLL